MVSFSFISISSIFGLCVKSDSHMKQRLKLTSIHFWQDYKIPDFSFWNIVPFSFWLYWNLLWGLRVFQLHGFEIENNIKKNKKTNKDINLSFTFQRHLKKKHLCRDEINLLLLSFCFFYSLYTSLISLCVVCLCQLDYWLAAMRKKNYLLFNREVHHAYMIWKPVYAWDKMTFIKENCVCPVLIWEMHEMRKEDICLQALSEIYNLIGSQ